MVVTKIESAEVIKSLGGEAKIRNRFQQHRQNMEYLQKEYAKLKEKYINRWIVIYNSKVIANESNPELFLERLSKIKSKDALIYYMAEREDSMII